MADMTFASSRGFSTQWCFRPFEIGSVNDRSPSSRGSTRVITFLPLDGVYPACLPESLRTTNLTGLLAYVIGWGQVTGWGQCESRARTSHSWAGTKGGEGGDSLLLGLCHAPEEPGDSPLHHLSTNQVCYITERTLDDQD